MKSEIKSEIKTVIEGILKVADKERKESKPYKDMFKRTDAKPFCVQLREVHSDMIDVVLNYTKILEENGYKVDKETYRFLLALPITKRFLEKDITEKDGWACSVDKVYTILHKEFKNLLKRE